MLVPLSHGTAVNNGHEEEVVYASTAEGRWVKKEKRKKEKRPSVYPLLRDPPLVLVTQTNSKSRLVSP